MSFLVHSVSPTDERWQERDILITKAAGRKSDGVMRSARVCEHSWYVPSFKDAVQMRKRLSGVDKVRAMVREQ